MQNWRIAKFIVSHAKKEKFAPDNRIGSDKGCVEYGEGRIGKGRRAPLFRGFWKEGSKDLRMERGALCT